MDKRKALLLGATRTKFHPLQGIDKQVTHLLNDMFTVQCTENHKMLHEAIFTLTSSASPTATYGMSASRPGRPQACCLT